MATILIVDDLAANRFDLVALLLPRGHRLVEAADGRTGFAAAQRERPDLVITDVLMAVMDGYELVRQLRLDPGTRHIPVLFYTAHYGESEARAHTEFGGVSDVLMKPADSAQVLAIVDRALSGIPGPWMRAGARLTRGDREHLRLLPHCSSKQAVQLRTANARLRAVINIGLEVATEHDPNRLLQRVCMATRDLFGATYVTLGILNRHDRTLQRMVACGTVSVHWMRTGEAVVGLLHTVVAERRPVRRDNPSGDPCRLQLPAHHPRVHALLAAPIASPAHVYGWIGLVGNEGQTFSEDDEHLLLALAGQVGRIYYLERQITDHQPGDTRAGEAHGPPRMIKTNRRPHRSGTSKKTRTQTPRAT
jgi:diguanylate cyclase